MTSKNLFVSILLLVLGLTIGITVTANWQKIKETLTATSSPTASQNDNRACTPQSFPKIGLAFCLPKDWLVKLEDGPQKLQLGKIILQSPDFDQIIDSTTDGLPLVEIKSGFQLSLTATRIAKASNLIDFSTLKQFWQTNKVGHTISRQEERLVDQTPALYHALTDPKVGNHLDTHILKGPLLYDLNFYFNQVKNPAGEDIFRSFLDSLTFIETDPLIITSDQLRLTSPTTNSSKPRRKPLAVSITTTGLEISSQSELPLVILRPSSGGPATILGTAQPVIASESAGLTTTNSFSFNWLSPDYGTYDLSAEVVKNSGQIYDSTAIKVIIR